MKLKGRQFMQRNVNISGNYGTIGDDLNVVNESVSGAASVINAVSNFKQLAIQQQMAQSQADHSAASAALLQEQTAQERLLGQPRKLLMEANIRSVNAASTETEQKNVMQKYKDDMNVNEYDSLDFALMNENQIGSTGRSYQDLIGSYDGENDEGSSSSSENLGPEHHPVSMAAAALLSLPSGQKAVESMRTVDPRVAKQTAAFWARTLKAETDHLRDTTPALQAQIEATQANSFAVESEAASGFIQKARDNPGFLDTMEQSPNPRLRALAQAGKRGGLGLSVKGKADQVVGQAIDTIGTTPDLGSLRLGAGAGAMGAGPTLEAMTAGDVQLGLLGKEKVGDQLTRAFRKGEEAKASPAKVNGSSPPSKYQETTLKTNLFGDNDVTLSYTPSGLDSVDRSQWHSYSRAKAATVKVGDVQKLENGSPAKNAVNKFLSDSPVEIAVNEKSFKDKELTKKLLDKVAPLETENFSYRPPVSMYAGGGESQTLNKESPQRRVLNQYALVDTQATLAQQGAFQGAYNEFLRALDPKNKAELSEVASKIGGLIDKNPNAFTKQQKDAFTKIFAYFNAI